MSADNERIAALFNRLADLLEIEDANPFRIRAYRNGAQTVREHARSMADLLKEGMDLTELPGIGKDLSEKIATILETDRLPALEEVEARTPGFLSDLMKVPGLGPKRVKTLYKELNIRSVDDLRLAARTGRIRDLPGFAERTEQLILKRTEGWTGEERRFNLQEAEAIAAPLLEWLQGLDGITRLIIAGSYRRRKESVGDLDVLVTARKGTPVMDRLATYNDVAEIVSKGSTRSTVRMGSGMQVDLRLVSAKSYGAALHYFTGSKAHNIAVRKMGVKKKLKVNEYGVFRGEKQIAGRTEKEIYALFGMDYIEPELRETRGELEAAANKQLPKLVTPKSIRGDGFCHVKDGRSLRALAQQAGVLGYRWLVVCFDAKGNIGSRQIGNWRRAVERVQSDELTLILACEAGINEDGSLDRADELLAQFDLVAGVIRGHRDLSAGRQTRRIIRALGHPNLNLLAHPTGRVIGGPAGLRFDIKDVAETAAGTGTLLGVDARPDRLDLSDEACHLARDAGARVLICSHARTPGDMGCLRFGLDQARRGWLEAAHVANTAPGRGFLRLLRNKTGA